MESKAVLRTTPLAAIIVIAACGGSSPTSPSQSLTATIETEHFSYHYSPGDAALDEARQEAHYNWAVARLGVSLPQKIVYNKYTSRMHMGELTGTVGTNAFAEPEIFTIHSMFPFDNHETVHVFSALVGRPSDFFNEGLAVAFQTNPRDNDLESRFNGQQVHEATADYRRLNLVPPLDQIVETNGFRRISDSTMSYRIAGSFARFLIDRFGIDRVKEFFRISGSRDNGTQIRQRFQEAFAQTLEAAEAEWLASLPPR
ncbi:MAG TPA: hypothetical protein VFO19_18625 [Vicinamibacterales bacterium]|nr:hypothetical protein [Vicinamibacterales bacterium]